MRRIGREWAQAGRGERGFSLLEVLMANVILAVGLLAIAAMQDIALSKNVDGRRMGLATTLAAEIIERIRFNSPVNSTVAGGVYPYNFTITCTGTVCSGAPAPTTTDATTQSDYIQWRNRLGTTDSSGKLPLPSARAEVKSEAITNPSALGQVLVTVTVSWNTGARQPTVTMNTIVAPL